MGAAQAAPIRAEDFGALLQEEDFQAGAFAAYASIKLALARTFGTLETRARKELARKEETLMRRSVYALDPETGTAMASLPAAVVMGWPVLSDDEIISFTKSEFVTLRMLSREDLERVHFEVRES